MVDEPISIPFRLLRIIRRDAREPTVPLATIPGSSLDSSFFSKSKLGMSTWIAFQKLFRASVLLKFDAELAVPLSPDEKTGQVKKSRKSKSFWIFVFDGG